MATKNTLNINPQLEDFFNKEIHPLIQKSLKLSVKESHDIYLKHAVSNQINTPLTEAQNKFLLNSSRSSELLLSTIKELRNITIKDKTTSKHDKATLNSLLDHVVKSKDSDSELIKNISNYLSTEKELSTSIKSELNEIISILHLKEKEEKQTVINKEIEDRQKVDRDLKLNKLKNFGSGALAASDPHDLGYHIGSTIGEHTKEFAKNAAISAAKDIAELGVMGFLGKKSTAIAGVLKKAVPVLITAGEGVLGIVEGISSLVALPEILAAIAVAGTVYGGYKLYNKIKEQKRPGDIDLGVNEGKDIGHMIPPTRLKHNKYTQDTLPTGASALGELIAKGESGGDYNAYNKGTHKVIKNDKQIDELVKPDKKIDLTSLTLSEVMRRQNLVYPNPDKLGAVGKYQLIKGTLKEASDYLHFTGKELFTPELQEKLFQYLINVKRPDIGNYISGKSKNKQAALVGLSNEWKSFSDPRTGRTSGTAADNASISTDVSGRVLDQMRLANTSKGNEPELKTRPLDKSKPPTPDQILYQAPQKIITTIKSPELQQLNPSPKNKIVPDVTPDTIHRGTTPTSTINNFYSVKPESAFNTNILNTMSGI